MPKYVCSNDKNHTFDQMTADGFCSEPECYGTGYLIEQKSSEISIEESSDDIRRTIGLCVLLMDASGSMRAQAFPGNPATKAQLVAASASGGIFDLKKLTRQEDAYIIGVMFDRDTHVIFTNSVSEIFNTYANASKFAEFLNSKFTYGGTDINEALKFARQIYDDFIQNGDLSFYGGPKNVSPIKHSILDKRTGEQKIVPNIRVLIYTDGKDEVTGSIEKNPFANEEVDILMGAFFGQGEEPGCQELKNILSKCPIHSSPQRPAEQFFLINDPNRIQTLRKLFRMASGASGFCPACLALDIDN